MKIILQKQPVNEAAALILNHRVVTPTGSRLGVLSMDVHARKHRLFIDICVVQQLPAVLKTADTASPLAPPPPCVHLFHT